MYRWSNDICLDGGIMIGNKYVTTIGPPKGFIGKAIAQLIIDLKWSSFLILYSNPKDLMEMKELLNERSLSYSLQKSGAIIRQMPENTDAYHTFLEDIRELGETNIVFYSKDIDSITTFFKHAKRAKLTESRFEYVLMDLDVHLLGDFFTSEEGFECNVTSLRIIKTESPIETGLGLTMDAVSVIGTTILSLKASGNEILTFPLLCDGGSVWNDGEKLNSAINNVFLESERSGILQFDKNYERSKLMASGFRIMNDEFTMVSYCEVYFEINFSPC
ncbi:unnamed protein product [Dracunculus medinensis]|uniref:ANF_receptor domain-containing protein n=1 Tax=Dracunculus medinensis TaxID=318479 RepID=A0A158Q6J2_DRAME|nr:unnamed protein product [Dracunculus medinensis]